MSWSRFNDSLAAQNIMFVDREEIINIFEYELKELETNNSYFKVIGLYGIGGIGKSSVINKMNSMINSKIANSHIITINMDIMHSAETFDNLVKVRKQIDGQCFYFDYALLLLWDIYKIETLDDDFMKKIKGNFQDILNIIENTGSMLYPYIGIGIDNVLNLVRKNIFPIINKLKLDSKILESIDNRFKNNPELLYEYMPHLLGVDIKSFALQKRMIAFFDSYERHIVDQDDWLKELIGSSQKGLHVISSREPLEWSVSQEQLLIYQIKELPNKPAELLLKCHLSPKHYPIIDTIINKTSGIPLYLELALNIYRNITTNNAQNIDDEFFYIKSRRDFVRSFLHHLPEEEQQLIFVLAVIRIFNFDIFEWIVKDLNLQCDVLKYEDLCKVCLINLLHEDSKFLKLHDVFSSNALGFISDGKQYRILKSYIKYIGHLGIYRLQLKQISILFKNLLTIVSNVTLQIEELEYLCDIFFLLHETHSVPELSRWLLDEKVDSVSPLRKLAKLLYIEKKNANKSYLLSKQLEPMTELGRHTFSFKLIQNYSCAIAGNYEKSVVVDQVLYNELKKNDILYWYYGKAIIYHADHLMLMGKFKEAIEMFNEYYDKICQLPYKEGDQFEARKQMAHCKRFNWLLAEADSVYFQLENAYSHQSGLKVYILVNRCETNCYFHPDIVFSLADEAVYLCEQVGRPKDLAKVYYSLAIAHLHLREYDKSKDYINLSIAINEEWIVNSKLNNFFKGTSFFKFTWS